MADFGKMAQAAKAAYETEVQGQKEQARTREAERKRLVDAGTQLLRARVVPLLEQAKREFTQAGVHGLTQEHFDVYNLSVPPRIKFWCAGPPRRSDGYRLETAPVFFSALPDEVVEVGVAKFSGAHFPDDGRSIGSAKGDEIANLVERGLKGALDAYFAEKRKYPHI